MDKEDKAYLLLREIEIPNLGVIHSPTVEEILKMGDKGLNNLLLPFTIDMETCNPSKEFLEKIKGEINREPVIYDVISKDKYLRNILLIALSYFYKTNNIGCIDGKYGTTYIINVGSTDTIIVAFYNFQELCEVIKKLMKISKHKEEERKVTIEHEENNAILQEYLRLQKAKQEQDKLLAQKNQLTIHDLVTIVASDCGWDYDKVMNMTYYRLINSYSAIMGKDNYQTTMMYHTSEKFDTSKMKIIHWTESIKKE